MIPASAPSVFRRCAVLGALSLTAAVLAQDPPPAPSGDIEGIPTNASSIVRHGIKWTFDRDYEVGAFANGDPWVLGPVRIVAIEPRCAEVEGRVMHGSMIDPDASQMLQGYDSHLFGDENRERYRDDLNVALGVGAADPLELDPGSGLVSVASRSDVTVTPRLRAASVLTCLDRRPAPDAFRPPYVKADAALKKVCFRAADLDFTQLHSVKPTTDTPPIDVVASKFDHLWLDHFPEWPTRYAHPAENMPDYGRDIAAQIGSGVLALQFDVDLERKRELLIRLVQIGLDLHAALRGGCRWEGIGGHGHGRKLPILLAGRVLHDEQMLAIGKDYVSLLRKPGDGDHFFGEDGQTFYVKETSKGVWNWGYGGYGKDHDDLPEWGFGHASSAAADDAIWEANPYRRCCTANGWVGQCLAARMLGLRDAWNHPAFFDYMDRYMQVRHTDDWHRSWVGWHSSMWDAYRSNH